MLIGRDGPLIGDALAGVAPVYTAPDLREAVRMAAGCARRGDRVLLSPACASFDMFRDYVERGDRFTAAVRDEVGA